MKIQNPMMSVLRRAAFGFLAVLLLAAGATSLVNPNKAFAAGQVSARSIQLSSSAKGATGVSYKVKFTPFTTGTQSIVIDFCGSAIVGAACTAPSGLNAATIGFTAGTGTTSWALGATAASTIKVTKSGGSALTTSSADFTITGITNPTNAGSFYARLYTYDCTDYGAHVGGGGCASTGTAYSSPTVIGSDIDYGGFAMSATDTVSINATVMETLTFCVNKTAPAAGCTSLSTPISVTLGHGSPVTLDSSQVDTDTIFTQLSTNAVSGASVALKTGNTCSGLSRDSGSTCPIPGIGAFATIPATTADFGLNVANGTGGTGTVTANGNYGTTASNYGMGSNVTTTFGDPIESSAAACANVNSTLTYAAQAAATTPAGVYSATHTLIATGTF